MCEWICARDRLPEEAYGCLCIVIDVEPMTNVDFLNFLPYFAGYDGETWNDSDGQQIPFEVTHWMKLPNIPQGEPGDYL